MMKMKVVWLLVSCLMVLSLVLASCGGEEEEEEEVVIPTEEEVVTPTEEEVVTPEGGENWWDVFGEPQYGGTITLRSSSDVINWDLYSGSNNWAFLHYETLGGYDMTVNRKIENFKGQYIPAEYQIGLLVESWDCPDYQTVIFHVRHGVTWQDKEPMNGRELTAYDIVYHYHRILGIGGGFTEGTPYYTGSVFFKGLISAEATDKWTVVFKWAEPSNMAFASRIDPHFMNAIEPPDAVELWGDLKDWHHAVGTGPWMLTDYVTDSSITYDKNPNYWRNDERYPENNLPYADTLKILIIPDQSTAYAALRTGKIDIISRVNWEQAQQFQKTNPELLQAEIPAGCSSTGWRNDKAPFSDIRVRKALNMSIDRETIAKTYYGGTADPTPYGMSSVPGYYTPFEEWPEELQAEYTYNPEGAKKLLAEAGYPNGFDTHIVVSSTSDLDLIQICQDYFKDIGINMEIRVMEPTVFSSYTRAGKHEQMGPAGGHGSYGPLFVDIGRRLSTNATNLTHNDDPWYDEMMAKYDATLDPEEYRKLHIELDMYCIKQHWSLPICLTYSYIVYQPWLKGYAGENIMWSWGFWYARFWIDSDIKEAMGH
jgi:peptide/nickel transport system substrate-binding protein